MSKADTLIRLVHTLTKAEKRYFRLYSSLQQGSKDYVKLFDLLESNIYPNTTAAREAFAHAHPGASYEVCSKYLYKVIMDCLLHLRLQHNEQASLTGSLLKTEILFERSLHEKAQHELQRIQQTARSGEKHLLLLSALQQEMQAIHMLDYAEISEKELLSKQAVISNVIRSIRHNHQHRNLYELLRHRLLHKGTVRTAQQKEALNDLLLHELDLVSKMPPETLESIKTHLLFQANYFLITGNYNEALKTFYELNQLLESHEEIWADTPAEHLYVIEGILDSLRSTGHYKELHLFLGKIRRFKSDAPYIEVMVHRLLFIYETASYIDCGDFEHALALQKEYRQSLFRNVHLLDTGKQAEIYLYMALVHLGNEDSNNAYASLEQVLQHTGTYSHLPIFRTFKLIHLLLHYEMGNYEYIHYETRAFRRHLQADNKRSHLLERTVIRFLRLGELSPVMANRMAMWKKISLQFDRIRESRYEMQLMKLFDFSAWIEAKLKKQPLREILQEKYQQAHST